MFQRPLDLQSPCRILVSLVGSFSTNKVAEDAVPNAHIETDARQNNMGLILLALFVPWELLPEKFQACHATTANFRDFCWQIWLDFAADLDEYTQFYANNILQMRKSQIECQLDRQQRKVAEAAAAETAYMEEMTAGLDSVERHDIKT